MQGNSNISGLSKHSWGAGPVHRLGRVVFWMLVIASVVFAGVRLVLPGG